MDDGREEYQPAQILDMDTFLLFVVGRGDWSSEVVYSYPSEKIKRSLVSIFQQIRLKSCGKRSEMYA